MKLRFLNSYRASEMTPEGRITKTRFRYAVTQATEEERAMFKKWKTQDGEDYYREEKGLPIHVTSVFYANEITMRGYKREDNTVGFSIDDSNVDKITSMMSEFGSNPAIATELAKMAIAERSKGMALDIEKINDKNAEPENNAPEHAHAGTDGEGLEGE
jgi:hypothetical protein